MTLTDNATLDLTEFEFEIPCENCDTAAVWAAAIAQRPCFCETDGVGLICDSHKRAIDRTPKAARVLCMICKRPTGLTWGETILSITPIKPGGAA